MPARKPKPAPAARRPALRTPLLVVLTVGAAAGLVLGVSALGDAARRGIGPRDRYRVRFADVECPAPPGTDRPTFLSEVRYVGDFPEDLNLMADADRDRLAAAFARHPWVRTVDGVDVEPPGRVRVRLTFRTPALAVAVEGGGRRHVDAAGVLLPPAAAADDVPELATAVPLGATAAGEVWGNEAVRRAVELVRAYPARKLERTASGWRLTLPDGRTHTVAR